MPSKVCIDRKLESGTRSRNRAQHRCGIWASQLVSELPGRTPAPPLNFGRVLMTQRSPGSDPSSAQGKLYFGNLSFHFV